MKPYSIHNVKSDEGDFFYCLYEEATEQAIDFYYFYEDALKVSKFMASGGAFNGFTPSFVLRHVPVPKNPNENIDLLNTD